MLLANRITEIIDYQSWFETLGQSVLEPLYKQFLAKCLSDNNLSAIVSFNDWKAI